MNDFDLPKSSLDFAGMGALRGQAQRHEDKATRETATQFEAMFIQMMLKSMREATDKEGLMTSDHEEAFQEMYDRELSVQLAKRNTLGVADMLVKSIDRSKEAGPAYKAKAEPIAINPSQEPLPLSGPRALPIELVRPEKFNVKPRSVTPVTDAGVE
jgi:Rod binding domain-containing protein